MSIPQIIVFALILSVVIVAPSILIASYKNKKYKKELEEEKQKYQADLEERKKFKERIKDVFHPFDVVLDYLEGKTIVLSDSIQFVYHKDNPEHPIRFAIEGMYGIYLDLRSNNNNSMYLLCEYEGQSVVVLSVK